MIRSVGRRRKKATKEQLDKFLEEYARTGLLHRSAYAAGFHPNALKAYRRESPEFDAEVTHALERFHESLEGEACRRARDGLEEPVFHQGVQCGAIMRFSDRLLELLLKRHLPEFRDKFQLDATFKGGVLVVPAAAGDVEEWRKRITSAPAP